MFFTFWSGLDMFNPGVSRRCAATGSRLGSAGRPCRGSRSCGNAWFDAPDLAAQQRSRAEIQEVAFQEVPYLPLGQYFQAWAYRRNITGVLKGLPLFWNVQRT